MQSRGAFLYLSMPLHEKIAEARRNKGFTQEELADRSSVTVRTIQRIESGDTVPRNFTLKAIAEALNMPFEELIAKNGALPTEQDTDKDASIHFLKVLNLSCFTYLVIPYVHFLIPSYLLKKKRDDAKLMMIGRKMIRTQIYWIVGLHLTFFLVLAYNLTLVRLLGGYYINYLWPFFIMYLLNAVIILTTHLNIKKHYK